MGTIFKYIADNIVNRVEPTVCPCCKKQAPVFVIDATPEQEEWSALGDRVDELCAGCIRAIPLRKLAPREQERTLQQLINHYYPKGTLSGAKRFSKLLGICDEFRRTPRMPLFLQSEDWPFCCGDFAEFRGNPASYEESVNIGRQLQLWDRCIADYKELYGDMTLEPESLQEVSLFKCPACSKTVFTWQCT